MPQIVINYNRSVLSQYGLTIQDINRNVNAAFSGQLAGQVYEGEKRFDLVVRMETESRTDVSDVQNLLIRTRSGVQIPLSTLADVNIVEGPNQIQRENTKRRIVIGFNARGRDVQSLVEELQAKEQATIKFPAGYNVEYGGSFKNLEKAKQRLSIAVPLALLLIFILLYFAFKSIKQGLLIFSAIPLSAIGGILALAILGLPFSISAGVGFIALFGVAVLNGIVLIAEFNRLKMDGMSDLKQIVLTGTKIRMRPVLMTAFVASLGFLPMAMSHGAGAEVQRPLASVVIGGLLLATLLTLFVLPVLYVLVTKRSNSKSQINISVVLVLITFTISGNSFAQRPISYQAAIDSAIANNLFYKNETLKAKYKEQLIRTATAWNTTDVLGEYGRLNSRYTDNRVSISQTLDFPIVYARRKNVFKEDWKLATIQVELKEKEVKIQVGNSYFALLVLAEKRKLLQRIDSIYAAYLSKAELRIRLGETNILEKITIENQRVQIGNQLKQLEDVITIEKMHFQWLLNTKNQFFPMVSNEKMRIDTKMGLRPALDDLPRIKLIDAQRKSALAQLKLEKAKYLPGINLGFVSGTMYGIGADNNFYTHTSRFNAGQIGLKIPVFSKQGQNIKLATINSLIVNSQSDSERIRIQNEIDALFKQFETQSQIIQDLEKIALPNARIIFETAQNQFVNGEIDYMEWAILINQSISIQSDYQDALMKYNELVIQINNL
jgi:cobalt-zinc-cadmium resistance protein CzcA